MSLPRQTRRDQNQRPHQIPTTAHLDPRKQQKTRNYSSFAIRTPRQHRADHAAYVAGLVMWHTAVAAVVRVWLAR